MRLEQIRIKNIRGIDDIEFNVRKLTIVAGDNAEGKSSVIDAVRNVFEGGHEPNLLRNGAQKGSVELVLDGGVITKTIKKTESSVKFLPAGEDVPIKSPQTFIKSLASGISFSPQKFIAMDRKKRAEYFLSVAPVNISSEEIQKASKWCESYRKEYAGGGLAGLEATRAAMYSERTKKNTECNQAGGAVESLKKSLPEAAPCGDWDGEIEKAENDRRLILEENSARLNACSQHFRDALRDVDRREAEKIAEIREEFAGEKASLSKEEYAEQEEIKSGIQGALSVIHADVARFRTLKEQSDRAEGIRASIETYRAQSVAANSRSEKLTDAIAALDQLKIQKLNGLPVAGITFEDGAVVYNGVDFDGMNTGQQYGLCFEIGMLVNGELPLMIWDGLAEFGDEAFEEFCQAALAYEGQIIGAKLIPRKVHETPFLDSLGDGSLTVKSFA